MSYVKYCEDDLKIVSDRIYMRSGSQVRNTKAVQRYYECKYCHQIFTTKTALTDHIKNIHNIVRPLIVINDRVIGDHVFLQYLQNAKILMYGFDGNISIGGDKLIYTDDDIDITNILKDKLQTAPTCNIIINDMQVKIELHPISIQDNSEIKAVVQN